MAREGVSLAGGAVSPTKDRPWIPIESREPPESRVLVARKFPDGRRYVDVIVWIPEPFSGLPPLPSKHHVTHWMPMPEPPGDD